MKKTIVFLDGNCVNGSGIQLTNSCLVKNVRGKSWYAAREDCISKGGDLAVLKDNDLEILRNYSHWSNPEIPRQKHSPYWIGLRDGEWFWIPGYRGLYKTNFTNNFTTCKARFQCKVLATSQ